MALSQVRTIYRNAYPEDKFFSSEKSGFVSGGEAAYYLINDLLTIGAFSLVNVKITDSGDFTIYSGWPVEERIYEIVNPGTGYSVGEKLQLINAGNGTPLTINITSVNSTVGSIESYQIIQRNVDGILVYPNYSDASATQPNPMGYATEDYLGIDPSYRTGQFNIVSNITNTMGQVVGSSPAPRTYSYFPTSQNESTVTAALENTIALWEANYGYKGSGGPLGSRHPAGVIAVFDTETELPTGNISIRAGQSIDIVDTDFGEVQTNTKIKQVVKTEIIGTLESYQDASAPLSQRWKIREKKVTCYLVYVDKPITALAGATFVTKGTGATFRNNNKQLPKRWVAVIESLGVCDPISDYVGVLGNVVSATTNTNTVLVNTLTVAGNVGAIAYKPTIYVGQSITNTDTVGQGVSSPVFVTNVVMTSTTTATVTMDSNQTLSSGKTLKFLFDPIQKWRLCIESQDYQLVNIYAGTEVQFPDDCSIGNLIANVGGTVTTVDRPGIMGSPLTGNSNVMINTTYVDQGFFNRSLRVVNDAPSYPINTQLTVTDRGIFFGAWEGNFSVLQKKQLTGQYDDNVFNWFLIQRPVDRLTGRILTTGRAPLFCINSVGYKYHKFIVRESDVFHPSQGPKKEDDNGVLVDWRTPADAHSNDSFAVLNTSNQIALTEDSKYLVSFLHNLTSPRFRYSEELDMLGQTSADVCISGNDLSITAYQESGPRVYKALPSNKPYNTGLRIVVLKDIPRS